MACFGTSGTCVQTAFDLAWQARGEVELVAYVADGESRSHHDDGLPILALDDLAAWDDVGVVVPVHDPAGRRSVHERVAAAGIPILGAAGMPHLSHPSATLGEGVIASSTTRIGPKAVLGRGTIAFADLVAHDVEIGEFTTLAVHSIVLGHVRIGSDVRIGAGAVISNGTAARPIVIGDGAVIGAGAVVDRHVGDGETVVSPRAVSIAEWQAMRSAGRHLGAAAS